MLHNTITVRQTQFKPEKIKAHYTESTLMSHFLTALSMSFPQGERFFVETVRNVRDQIHDEQLIRIRSQRDMRRQMAGYAICLLACIGFRES